MRLAKPIRFRAWLCGVAAATLAAASPSFGQAAIGAKAGVSLASFSGDGFDEVTWKRGYAAGLFLTWHLVEELSFQTEALYQQKGANVRVVDGGSSFGVDLDYAELAALFRLDVHPLRNALAVYVAGGPGAAVSVGCRIVDSANGTRGCADPDPDLSVKRFDFSMIGAAGLAVPLSRTRLFVEGRYSVGFGFIDAGPVSWERTNHALAVLAGLSVPLGRRTRLAGQ